ncbi:MAG: response regulator [Betaproteobacteria bacterium]|nr:response regulator [Betaproteobacteria bacterium]
MNEEAGYRILVVEDHPVNQLITAQLLQKRGHSVSLADNGRLGLESWRRSEHDLILMDIMMPEMDGLEATLRIRAEEAARGEARIPIVALTANALPEDKERCLAAGMDGYIAKPFKPERLFGEIERVMGKQTGGGPSAPATPVTGVKPDAQVFDRVDALARIGGDEELLDTLIGMFVDDAPRYLSELDAALDSADWPRLARGAHDLKGVLATFSAWRALDVAKALEQAGKAGRGAAAAELLSPLRRELDKFLSEVAR